LAAEIDDIREAIEDESSKDGLGRTNRTLEDELAALRDQLEEEEEARDKFEQLKNQLDANAPTRNVMSTRPMLISTNSNHEPALLNVDTPNSTKNAKRPSKNYAFSVNVSRLSY